MRFSIIIPVKEINDYIREFIPIILEQSFKDFEIIILPNEKSGEKFKKTKIVPTGNVGPAEKRDIGAKIARGDILAFIDDDAYPEKNWLKNADVHFKTVEVAGLGGPQLTPQKSNYFQKLSGEVLSSFIVSGTEAHRYKISGKKECYDLPSCNLFIRKKDFENIGGFDTGFWPGEDTKLCLDIKKSGWKMLYTPDVVVHHHRRKDLRGYIKQIFEYASHRGYFVKKYPETSRKISYFVPSLFVFGLVIGLFLSLFNYYLFTVYSSILMIYFLLIFIAGIKSSKGVFIFDFVTLAFITHLIYGIGFLKGMFKKEIVNKYR